ncbi:MAG: hypothetical protein LRZ94_01015 [Candidatus Pacebacteria bacterium]|nr:hypothetical protein [Candidatus Paceibacterota bacterium]
MTERATKVKERGINPERKREKERKSDNGVWPRYGRKKQNNERKRIKKLQRKELVTP